MRAKVSTKGQVVLPEPLRRRLDIRAGDELDARVESGTIVLAPRRKPAPRGRILTDPITGLPVLTVGPGAPRLTSRQVRALLADFP